MEDKNSKQHEVIVSLNIKDIRGDLDFFNIPNETSQPEMLKNFVLDKYKTKHGILKGQIDGNDILLHWKPVKFSLDSEVLFDRALDFISKNEMEKAVALIQKAIKFSHDGVDYYYKLGLILYERRQYAKSIEVLRKAIQICPIHHRSTLLIGLNYMKLRSFDDAKKFILESNRINRKDVLTFLHLGVIYSIQQKFNDSIQMFNKTIELSPNETRAYLGLARIYSMLNDVETSNKYFKKIIEIAPDTKIAEFAKRSIVSTGTIKSHIFPKSKRGTYISKGMGYYISGEYAMSAKQYRAYLKNKTSDDFGWYLFGESKLRCGDLEEASDCFKRAIKLNNKNGLYFKALGIVKHYQGKPTDTIDTLKKADELGKKDDLCTTLIGMNYIKLRKIEDAIRYLELSIQKNPNNPLALYYLALAYFQNNDKNQAVQMIDKVMAFEYFMPLKNQAQRLLKNIQI